MPTFTASTPLWQFHLLRSPSFFFAMCKHCIQGPANQIPKICEFYLGAYMTIYPDTCFLKITYASYVYTLYALAYELLNPTVHMWHSSTHLILSHWMPAQQWQQWLRPPRGSFPASCGDAPRPVPAASHVPRRHRYITQAQRNSI